MKPWSNETIKYRTVMINAIPLKLGLGISCKDQNKPWMNQPIKSNIQKRENNYKLFKQRLISERKYKYFCNLVSSQIRIKKKYYEIVFHENKNNLREAWKVINKVLSKMEKRSRLEVKSILNDNRIYTDGLQICELFNKYFSSVSSKIHESIPSPTSENDFSYYLRNIQISSYFSFSRWKKLKFKALFYVWMKIKLMSLHIPTKSWNIFLI